MTQPTPYRPSYDFGDAGTALPPGVPLDTELLNIQRTFAQILKNLSLIQKDDTTLRNGIVGVDQFDARAMALIGSDAFTVAGEWVSGTDYAPGAFVSADGVVYLVMADHVAVTIDAGLAEGALVKIFEVELGTRTRDDFVGNNIQTVFKLDRSVVRPGDVEVFLGGELQPTSTYTVVGADLSFAVAPANGVNISVLSLTWATTPPLATLVNSFTALAAELSLATGAVLAETWTELAAIEGEAGQKAVSLTGSGTHIDPVTSATVKNTGFFLCVAPPFGWQRVADLQSDLTAADVIAVNAKAVEVAAAATAAMEAVAAVKQIVPFAIQSDSGIEAGAWYAEFFAPVDTTYDTWRAWIFLGSGTLDLSVNVNDVLVYGPRSVGSTVDAASPSFAVEAGDRISFEISNIVGAPLGVAAQLLGLPS